MENNINDNIGGYNLTESAYKLVVEQLSFVKSFSNKKQINVMNIIKDFWNLPESIQKDISTKYYLEYLEGKPVSINRFANIMKEYIEYCKTNNINLDELRLEEDRKKAEDANRSVLEAMAINAKRLESHPKYNFDGVRFDDGSSINPTYLTNEGPTNKRSL